MKQCPNDAANYPRTYEKLAQWEAVFLRKAKTRLQKQLDGYDLSFHDIRNFVSLFQYAVFVVLTDHRWRCVPTRFGLAPLAVSGLTTADRRRWLLCILPVVHAEGMEGL